MQRSKNTGTITEETIDNRRRVGNEVARDYRPRSINFRFTSRK